MTEITYELAAPNVVAEKFQEGLVILNLDTGKYFDAGERLVPLMDALDAKICVDAIKKGVNTIESGAGVEISDVINKMIDFGLIREAAATTRDISSDMCLGILNAGNSFFIESHDDLAELIAADPIHDIDPATGRIVR